MSPMPQMRPTPQMPQMQKLRTMHALVLAISACGGSSGPAPAPPAASAVIATPKLTAEDVEVARVNGRPVWSSCVAIQAGALAAAARAAGPPGAAKARAPRDERAPMEAGGDAAPAGADRVRREALEQCIAFELLAQAAEARGLSAAREVGEASRTAQVNRLVATDFERRYRTPDDLRPAIDLVMKRNEWRLHIVELRASTFARFLVPDAAPAVLAERARALAERLAAELTGQTGLYSVHLSEAARRIAAGSDVQLETTDVRPVHRDDLVAPYAEALYGIPEVGRIAGPVRTQWGWDVVLWTGGVEAKDSTREELAAEMFPEIRRQQFQLWVTQLAKQRGVHVSIDRETVAKLDDKASAGGSP